MSGGPAPDDAAGSQAPVGPVEPVVVGVAAATGTDPTVRADGAPGGVRPARRRRPDARGGRGSTPRLAAQVAATVAAVGILLIGAAPMAAAAIDRTADPQIAVATDGVPNVTTGPAPAFRLVDQTGAAVSLADLRGYTVVLTFLDPVCTTDCPIIAQELRSASDLLGGDAAKVRLVAVVANPVYRSVQAVDAFDRQEGFDSQSNWLYLTGSRAALEATWYAYGVDGPVLAGRRHGGPRRRRLRHRLPRHDPTHPRFRSRVLRCDDGVVLQRAARLAGVPGPTAVTRRVPLIIGGVAVVVVVGLVVLVLTSGGTGTTQPTVTVVAPPPSATVAAATTTPVRSTVVLAMGHLGDPANTFYELFERPTGRSAWTLVTPPGVADNGGLVVGLSPAGALTAGFLPSGRSRSPYWPAAPTVGRPGRRARCRGPSPPGPTPWPRARVDRSTPCWTVRPPWWSGRGPGWPRGHGRPPRRS